MINQPQPKRRYEQVAELINAHATPYEIRRKLRMSAPVFRAARKLAADRGLIVYTPRESRPRDFDQVPRIYESDEAAKAWAGVWFGGPK